tara:strand:- start:3455 stop:3778 length:324 start_codon:yes stop_codon:yes gene_type:complete
MNNFENKYRPLPEEVCLQKSSIEGCGIHAKKTIPKNVRIGMTHVSIVSEPDWIRTPLGGWLNHSEKPNCHIEYNFLKTKRFLVTSKRISKGKELTVRYSLKHYVYDG